MARDGQLRRIARLAAIAVALMGSRPVHAQSDDESESAPHAESKSLRDRLALATGERWLASNATDDRLRGLERLGTDGSPRALALIAAAVAPGGTLTSAEERLTAARVLAPHAASDIVRPILLQLMSGPGSGSEETDELDHLARVTAAIALANSGSPAALAALARALRHQGSIASMAATALRAHPPRDPGVLASAAGPTTPQLVDLLGELSDQRTRLALRDLVRHGTRSIRSRAALALARLGDMDTVALARHWLERSDSDELHATAAELLAIGHAGDAPKAIADLLAEPAMRSEGLRLALAYPVAEVVAPVLAHLDALAPDEVASAYAVLGRAGTPSAVRRLVTEIRRAGAGSDAAAYALATSPGARATEAIETLLGEAACQRTAARAGVLRALVLGDEPAGLGRVLETLLVSGDPADRAAGAWGVASLDVDRRIALIQSSDPAIVGAAMRAASDRASRLAAAKRLATLAREPSREALTPALADLEAARAVPTAVLVDLLETMPVAAPLVARALASRGGPDLAPRIDELLESGDALIRAHTALGLGSAPMPSAVGRLERAYRFERDPMVRRAVVRALAQRREAARRRTLELAARLDPDADVRRLAMLALRGVALPVGPLGGASLWITLADSSLAGASSRPVAVVDSTGLALPFTTDPDGRLTLWGLARGPLALRLAPALPRGKAPDRGPVQAPRPRRPQ